jgi:hypothetical protein
MLIAKSRVALLAAMVVCLFVGAALGLEKEKSFLTGQAIGELAVAGRLDVDLHAQYMLSRTFKGDVALNWYNCGFSGGGQSNEVGGAFGDFGLHVHHSKRAQSYPHAIKTPQTQAVHFDGGDIMKANFDVEDEAAGGQDFTIEVWVRDTKPSAGEIILGWQSADGKTSSQGGKPNQRLIEFAADNKTRMILTPADSGRCPSFSITKDGVTQTLRSSSPLPRGKWVKLTVTLNGSTGTLKVDGKTVATNKAFTLNPEDLRATRCSIGRGLEGNFFAGELEDVSIHRIPLSDVKK